jgi:hypothetical protein
VNPDRIVAGAAQEQGGDRGIDPAGHGYEDFHEGLNG